MCGIMIKEARDYLLPLIGVYPSTLLFGEHASMANAMRDARVIAAHIRELYIRNIAAFQR